MKLEKYLDFRKNIDDIKLKEVGTCIKNGGLVLFPTETVYGLGANGFNENAVNNIFLAKGRKQDNPLILHISNMEMLNSIAKNINDMELKLMKSFWPGPFTIILNKTDLVPNVVTGNLDTVAVRMPNNEIAKKLIEYSCVPIAAPSANISGKPSGTNLDDIFDELSDKVDILINGGNCQIGLESTVVRVVDNIPHILRPGKITPEDIKSVAGAAFIDKHILNKLDNNEKVLSPGMKYKHYAPNSKCILVYNDNSNKLISKISEIANTYSNPLIVCCTENYPSYFIKNKISIGSRNNLEEISKNLFSVLRKVDSYKPDIVIIEGVKKQGLGLAIMNRLIRTCEYNFIEF